MWGADFYSAVDEQGNVCADVEFIDQTCTFEEWIGGDLTCWRWRTSTRV